ncbi:MAG TPA: hypothetical protein VGF88_13990 [Acidobacteriaceae bacterium]|jgi:hypothetical protein
MRSGNTVPALALSLALLTGCGPKHPRASIADTAEVPSLPPARMVALLSPVPPPMPLTRRPVKLDTTAPPEIKTHVAAAEPHPPPRHHSKPAQDTSPAETAKSPAPQLTPAQTTQEATAQPPEMTPIGQLSTANDNSNTADRHVISTQIDATETGVNAVKRPLSIDEQKTVALIRSYITRARDALNADDLAGANNLSTKAHQLLLELTKP